MVDRQLEDLDMLILMRRRGTFFPAEAAPDALGTRGGMLEDPFERLKTMLGDLKTILRQREVSRYDLDTVTDETPATLDATRAAVPDLDSSFWQQLLSESAWNTFDAPSASDWTSSVIQ